MNTLVLLAVPKLHSIKEAKTSKTGHALVVSYKLEVGRRLMVYLDVITAAAV